MSQLAHGREDERLQPVDVLLRREGDADPVELAELAVAPVRFGLQLRHLPLEGDILHRNPDQLTHGRHGRVDRYLDRDGGHLLRRVLARREEDERRLLDLARVGQALGFQPGRGQAGQRPVTQHIKMEFRSRLHGRLRSSTPVRVLSVDKA